jgi:hypothetical protein
MELRLKNTLKRCGHIVCAAALLSVPVTLAVTSAPIAEAQAVGNAKMHGIVADPTGAIIPGATLVATRLESDTSTTATSSDTGRYVLPNLPDGAYAIRITAPGFQTYNRTGIALQVSNDVEVNAPMTIGATDTVINVDASATAPDSGRLAGVEMSDEPATGN